MFLAQLEASMYLGFVKLDAESVFNILVVFFDGFKSFSEIP